MPFDFFHFLDFQVGGRTIAVALVCLGSRVVNHLRLSEFITFGLGQGGPTRGVSLCESGKAVAP